MIRKDKDQISDKAKEFESERACVSRGKIASTPAK